MTIEPGCVFCAIAAKEAPASVIYDDRQIMAILDIQPFARGHTLVLPKSHTAKVQDLRPFDAGYLFTLVPTLVKAIRLETGCDGVNIFASQGEVAGQEVPHVHLHIVPRFAGDGLQLKYVRDLALPRPSMPARKDLDALAARIQAKLSAARG